jgi:hypothetical protein
LRFARPNPLIRGGALQPVARIEQSEIRGEEACTSIPDFGSALMHYPDFTAFNPGYELRTDRRHQREAEAAYSWRRVAVQTSR